MKPKHERDEALDNLFSTLSQIKSEGEMKAFLKDLCTPAELEAFADRWRVANMIYDEIPYRQIGLETGVSTATITRVARFLHSGNDGYLSAIKKNKK